MVPLGRQLPAPPFGVRSTRQGVHFCQPGERGRLIHVAGDFNQWLPLATPLCYDAETRRHHTLVEIPPGRYRYRLVVDGRWQADPYNDVRQLNEYDETNSVLIVPDPEELE